MPEHLRQGTGHERYAELCALAAGGLLDAEDFFDLQSHMNECRACHSDYEAWSNLVTGTLPQAKATLQEKLAVMRAQPLPFSRERFLRRARAEGVVFSPEVETPSRPRPWYLRPIATLSPVAVLVVVVVGLAAYELETRTMGRVEDASTTQQVAELKHKNSDLTAKLSQLNESLAAGQRETQELRVQLGNLSATAENLRRNTEQARGAAEHSSNQNAQLLEEARNQEKLLAEAKDEAARASRLRVNDEASLVEQQARITELSNKLRIASATLDLERQLAAAGKDIRELMMSRQLHVIDVHDTDPNGNPSKAFGRVFLTEGKALTFYAFDLNDERVVNAKRGFQVWAALQSGNSAQSLGFLHVDSRGLGRWVLKVENPALVKDINSVFVTVESTAGGKQPSGQKILYAYLGMATHP